MVFLSVVGVLGDEGHFDAVVGVGLGAVNAVVAILFAGGERQRVALVVLRAALENDDAAQRADFAVALTEVGELVLGGCGAVAQLRCEPDDGYEQGAAAVHGVA